MTRSVPRSTASSTGSRAPVPQPVFPPFTTRTGAVPARTRASLERIRGRANQPAQALRLVAAYLGFALLHTARWRLVFEHRLPDGQKAPPTYAGHTAAIFALVSRRLHEAGIGDGSSSDEIATALWGGVHGICMLAVLLDQFLGAGVATPVSKSRPRRR